MPVTSQDKDCELSRLFHICSVPVFGILMSNSMIFFYRRVVEPRWRDSPYCVRGRRSFFVLAQ